MIGISVHHSRLFDPYSVKHAVLYFSIQIVNLLDFLW